MVISVSSPDCVLAKGNRRRLGVAEDRGVVRTSPDSVVTTWVPPKRPAAETRLMVAVFEMPFMVAVTVDV